MAVTSKKGQQALKGTNKINTLPGYQEAIHTNNTHKQQTAGSSFAIGKPQKETKSKRVNLVLQPSLYEKAQAVAKANGVSFNEMVTQLLQQITADSLERPNGQMTIDDI